jgi:hypothetical protein
MNKREFLKTSSVLGLASILPVGKIFSGTTDKPESLTCTLIPTETAGPFPLDLTANTTFFRQDIRESKTGVPFTLRLKIIGDTDCAAIPNLRVNIWHCDKDGLYSGYSQTNNPGQAGLTYLRGYQFTDSNGEVSFTTIFPGWYTGRICHIHFQVYVSSSYAAVSQLTFDIATKQAIYTANPTIYTNGTDPMTLASDNVFSDGYTYQMATLTPNSTTGGYDGYLEVTIQSSSLTSVGHLEKENAKQFDLGQNYPNPYIGTTTIPVSLKYNSDVKVDIYDLQGRIVATIEKPNLASGDHQILIDTSDLGIASANYIYQLEIKNLNGLFRDCKMMTASK